MREFLHRGNKPFGSAQVWDAGEGPGQPRLLKGHAGLSSAWRGAPTANAWRLTGSQDSSAGCGMPRRASWSLPSRDTQQRPVRGVEPRWQATSSPAAGTKRPRCGTPPRARRSALSRARRWRPQRGVQPRRQTHRQRQRGQDGEGVGRRHGPGGSLPQGTHRRGHQRGVQPRRQTHRSRGSGDKTVKVWDAATGQETLLPQGAHTLDVNSVAFSPDGKRIAQRQLRTSTAKVWDAATGQETAHPQGAHAGHGLQRGVQPRRQTHRSAAARTRR